MSKLHRQLYESLQKVVRFSSNLSCNSIARNIAEKTAQCNEVLNIQEAAKTLFSALRKHFKYYANRCRAVCLFNAYSKTKTKKLCQSLHNFFVRYLILILSFIIDLINQNTGIKHHTMPPPQRLTWRTFLTVEPVIFLYAYGLFMSNPIFQQYVYYRISAATGFPYNPAKKAGCAAKDNMNTTMKDLENQVQLLASRFDIANVMCLSVPSIIIALFVGPWTDTGGRKPALASPVIGAFIEALNAIIVMYTKWPAYMLFIGSVVNGFCGFFTIMTQTAMAYIADTTPEKKIALRMAIMQLMILIGGLVSQMTSGLWITGLGFIPPYWFVLACQLTAAVYVIIFVPESKPKRKNRVRFFSLNSLKVIWSVYRDPRHGYRRSLFLLFIGDGIVSLTTMGLSGVILLFVLRTPLCWSPNILGGFMALRFLTQGLGGVIGIGIMKRFCSDLNIARIGLTSLILSLVLFAFAKKTPIVFLVPVVGCLTGAVSPVMKGMMSQITRPDERGATFSAVAAISTLCNFAGAFIFNPIYIRSLSFGFPGLVFLISAVLALFPLISMSFIRNTEYFPAPTSSEAECSDIEDAKMMELNQNNTEEKKEDQEEYSKKETPDDDDVVDNPTGDLGVETTKDGNDLKPSTKL